MKQTPAGMHQWYAWTGFGIFWIRTPVASNRIRSEVFFAVAGVGMDLDFVFSEQTVLVVCLIKFLWSRKGVRLLVSCWYQI